MKASPSTHVSFAARFVPVLASFAATDFALIGRDPEPFVGVQVEPVDPENPKGGCDLFACTPYSMLWLRDKEGIATGPAVLPLVPGLVKACTPPAPLARIDENGEELRLELPDWCHPGRVHFNTGLTRQADGSINQETVKAALSMLHVSQKAEDKRVCRVPAGLFCWTGEDYAISRPWINCKGSIAKLGAPAAVEGMSVSINLLERLAPLALLEGDPWPTLRLRFHGESGAVVALLHRQSTYEAAAVLMPCRAEVEGQERSVLPWASAAATVAA